MVPDRARGVTRQYATARPEVSSRAGGGAQCDYRRDYASFAAVRPATKPVVTARPTEVDGR